MGILKYLSSDDRLLEVFMSLPYSALSGFHLHGSSSPHSKGMTQDSCCNPMRVDSSQMVPRSRSFRDKRVLYIETSCIGLQSTSTPAQGKTSKGQMIGAWKSNMCLVVARWAASVVSCIESQGSRVPLLPDCYCIYNSITGKYDFTALIVEG